MSDNEDPSKVTPDEDQPAAEPEPKAEETPSVEKPNEEPKPDTVKEPEQKVEEKPEAKPDEPKSGRIVPEKYELKLPENSLLTADDLEEVSHFAKEHKMTQEEADKVLNNRNAFAASFWDRKTKELDQEARIWAEAVKNDKEVGLDKFNESMELTRRFIEHYGDEDFVKVMKDNPLANYPGFVRMLVRASRDIGEGKFIQGQQTPAKDTRTLAERMYPKHAASQGKT